MLRTPCHLLLLGTGFLLPEVFAETPEPVTIRRSVPRDPAVEAQPAAFTLATLARSGVGYTIWQREKETWLQTAQAKDIRQLLEDLQQDLRPSRMTEGQWYACVNDLFAYLIEEAPRGMSVEQELIAVARNATDTVVRDYALQHVAILAKTSSRAAPRELLWEAGAWTTESLSGTALINLYHLDEGVQDGKLADQALAVAADAAAHPASRSTALQVGVLLEDPRFLEPATEMAGRTPVVAHRISALRVIALYGGPEHRTLLRQLRRKGPEPVRVLSQEALTRIDHDAL